MKAQEYHDEYRDHQTEHNQTDIKSIDMSDQLLRERASSFKKNNQSTISRNLETQITPERVFSDSNLEQILGGQVPYEMNKVILLHMNDNNFFDQGRSRQVSDHNLANIENPLDMVGNVRQKSVSFQRPRISKPFRVQRKVSIGYSTNSMEVVNDEFM